MIDLDEWERLLEQNEAHVLRLTRAQRNLLFEAGNYIDLLRGTLRRLDKLFEQHDSDVWTGEAHAIVRSVLDI